MNYDLHPGEVLAIVGESGSGKSSSSMALVGLTPPNGRVSGKVLLKGTDIVGVTGSRLRSIRGKDIAVIFQEPMTALNPVYTIGFQIVETLRTHIDMSPAEAKARAIELLTMVEMPTPDISFNKYPHQFSGGQRQRAMIAMAISCDPLLLIADEPTTALDVTVQAEILDLMRNLRHRLDSAIILITHDMGVVADLADKVIVMKDGVIVEAGEVNQIYTSPQHAYTKQLLAAVPHLGTGEAVVTEALKKAEATKSAPVLALKDVCIDYPKRGRVPAFRAVDGIDLEIFPGEVVGLVGESGSGKTTVGRAAVGLLPVAEGSLTVYGNDLADRQPEEGARDPPRHRHRLPGPGVVAEPAFPDRPVHRRADPALRSRQGRRARPPRRDAARPGRTAALVPQPLPARTLGRPAPARRHRSGARAQSRRCSSPMSRPRHWMSRCRPDSSSCCRNCSSSCSSPACSSATTSRSSTCSSHRIAVMHNGKLVEQGTQRRDPAQPDRTRTPSA